MQPKVFPVPGFVYTRLSKGGVAFQKLLYIRN